MVEPDSPPVPALLPSARHRRSMRKQRHLPPVTRRRFVQLGSALAAHLLLPSVSRAEGTPQVLIVGDSMIAGGFGLYLERALRDEHQLEVLRRGKSSTGLARPDFFDWIAEAKRLVESFTPDVSVVMFGGNDVQGLYMGKGEWIRWHEPGWNEEYARRINAFCDVLAPAGQRIYWVGMPVMRPPKFHERVQRVNTIFRAEMAIRPHAEFIDIWWLLSDQDGNYADRIHLEPPSTEPAAPGKKPKKPKRVRVRAGDGIHLSPAGAHHLARHVRSIIVPDLA